MGLVVATSNIVRTGSARTFLDSQLLATVLLWEKIPAATNVGSNAAMCHTGPHQYRSRTAGTTGSATGRQSQFGLTTGASSVNFSLNFGTAYMVAMVFADDGAGTRSHTVYAIPDTADPETVPTATATGTPGFAMKASGGFLRVGDSGGVVNAEGAQFGGYVVIAGKALTAEEIRQIYAGETNPQDYASGSVTVAVIPLHEPNEDPVASAHVGLVDLGNSSSSTTTIIGTPAWNDWVPHAWAETEPTEPGPGDPTDAPYTIGAPLRTAIAGGTLSVVSNSDSIGQVLDARVIQAMFYATTAFPPVRGIAMGHNGGNAFRPLRALTAQEASGTNVKAEATGSTNYRVFNREGTPSHFGVPIETVAEWFCDSTLTLVSSTQICRYDIRNRRLGEFGTRKWLAPDAKLRGSLILLGAPAGKQLDDIKLVDPNGTLDAEYDLLVDGVKLGETEDTALAELRVAASWPEFTLEPAGTAPDDIQYNVSVQRGTTDPVSSNKYILTGGLKVYQIDATTSQRLPGTYWLVLAGNSWSFSGFIDDVASSASRPKVFADANLVDWLHATAIAPASPVVIVVHLALENNATNSVAAFEAIIDAFVARMDLLYAEVYTQDPLYLFVLPAVHKIGSNTADELATRFENATRACNSAAGANERISYVSIARMMDYTFATLLEGEEAARTAYTAWALAKGWDAVVLEGLGTGDVSLDGETDTNVLLDSSEIHPGNAYAAAAMARLVAEALDAPPVTGGSGATTPLGDMTMAMV